jgi:hypothetical protein
LSPGTPEWDYGMTIFRWQASPAEINTGIEKSSSLSAYAFITPIEIVLPQHFLKKDGYGPRQIWGRDEKYSNLQNDFSESKKPYNFFGTLKNWKNTPK